MADATNGKPKTELLDELEEGPWPSFVKEIKSAAETSEKAAPASGPEMYAAYCAGCHGKTGKGDCQAASALKVAPPDLTMMARRNGGRFPDGQAFQAIEWGGTIPSHGTRKMPVWGVALRPLSNENQKQVTARLEALTRYIGSIQQ